MKSLFSSTMKPEITLRPYQANLIDDARNELAKLKDSIKDRQPRIVARAATGLGKTITSGKIAENVVKNGKRAIFAVHRRDLVFQAYESYKALGIDCGLIISGTPYDRYKPVQVASIDTIHARKNHLEWLRDFELIVADECHTALSEKWQSLRDLCPKAFEVGLTATPSRQDGKGLGDVYDGMVHAPDYAWAVENGYLVKPRYISVPESESQLLKVNKNGEYTEGSQESAFEKVTLVGGAVNHYKRFANNRPTVIFAPSVKSSIKLCEQFNQAGFTAVHIDANTDREVRQAAYVATKSGEVQVLCNYGVLDRGFDLPEISCVILMREVKHITPYIQMIGRGLRTAEGKTDCIVIDLGENVYRHGCFVDDPVTWTLDGNESATKEREEARAKEPKEITCFECKSVYKSSPICPYCGAAPTAKQIEASLPETRNASLEEVKPEKRITPEVKADFYAMCLTHTSLKGWAVGAASHMFKDKFGHFPAKKKGISPKPMTDEFRNWLKHRNIKRAKSRAKSGRSVDLNAA